MWRSLGLLVVMIGLASVVLWWTQAGADRSEGATAATGDVVDNAADAGLLAKPQAAELVSSVALPRAPVAGPVIGDPVVIGPCNLAPAAEQEVSSQIDAVLLDVVAQLGQRVGQNQLLGRLDDRLIRPQVELLQIKAGSESAKRIAKALFAETAVKVKMARDLAGKQSISKMDLESSLAQHERWAEEVRKAEEDQEVARKELEKALRTLETYEIKSRVSGEVTKVFKRPGEAVRQSEPLFRVANFDQLWAEGLCKVAQANLIRVGMRALVEPEQPGEQITELAGHTAPVTSLAVSPDGRLIASASEDRTVLLWRWPQGSRLAVLPHPAEVNAVTMVVSPKPTGGPPWASRNTNIITGCADGRIRLWSLTTEGRLEGPSILPGGHEGPVRALAVSADVKRLASGGDDKRIAIWNLAERRCLCWLQGQEEGFASAHQGAVTSVHFTPDDHLVSAGRDNFLKVWKLGDASGQLVGEQGGRTGDAAHLGVSPDGTLVLFDQGEELRVLDRRDWSRFGALRSRRQGRFQAFALFSPSGRLVLTAGDSGRLLLWKAPAAPETSRFFRQAHVHGFHRDSLLGLGLLDPWQSSVAGAAALGRIENPSYGKDNRPEASFLPKLWDLDPREIRFYHSPGATTPLCAAFAPDESVIFSGGKDKVVRAWRAPAASAQARLLEAEITYVGNQVERGTDLVRVRALLKNPAEPADRLKPGTFVHLRIYPETAPVK